MTLTERTLAAHSAVLVAGTGPVGLAAAIALADQGFAITLAGPPVTSASVALDQRTTALFGGSIELLRHLQVWDEVVPVSAALTGLRLIDATGRLLRAPETLFRASELGRPEFGFNITNASLVEALARRAMAHPGIRHLDLTLRRTWPEGAGIAADFNDGTTCGVALVVGADGRASAARAAAGIGVRRWSYPQSALATRFTHSRPHAGISTELHTRAGPLTTVPLPGLASSLVWVDTPEATTERLALPDTQFARALEGQLEGLLGTVSEVGPRAAFPLSGLTAEPIARARTMLAGEAAHVLPPIGAQGLNLGFRDVAWIADVTAAAAARGWDIGGDGVLDRYIAARRTDVATRGAAVDTLNRSLIADLLPLDLLRGAGIVALHAVPPLRRLVMREGIEPAGPLPRLLRSQQPCCGSVEA